MSAFLIGLLVVAGFAVPVYMASHIRCIDRETERTERLAARHRRRIERLRAGPEHER